MYESFNLISLLFILKSSYKLPFAIKIIPIDCKSASSLTIHRIVMSTSQPHLEAHAGFCRFSIKRTFNVYIVYTVTFWRKVDFHIINTC